tara:strand:+ start:58223 stop:59023 length:801 start_codon:yes stop_codon:yes gene_type:complete
MKKTFILIGTLLNILILSAQDFEGVLLYECKTNIHIKKEVNFKVQNPNRKKDSTQIIINDSTYYNRLKNKGTIVDSIRVVFGKKKFKKTYYKKDKTEFIFDLLSGKKITHTPKYECIDTTQIKLIDYKNKIKTVKSDSTYIVNGLVCQKIKISLSNYYFIELYYTKSEFKNLADLFIYDINNNLLFQNLYFLKEKLQYKKIVKLKYYSKPNAVDFEYILSSLTKKQSLESDFSLPTYDYCYWDIFEDKKLMRKHKKKIRREKKNKQ